MASERGAPALDLSALGELDGPAGAEGNPPGLAEARLSAKTWSGLGAEDVVPGRLLRAAMQRIAKGSPRLAEAWKRDDRSHDNATIAYREASADPALRAAFRDSEEIRSALALLRTLPPRRLHLNHWMIARLGGDTALEAKVAAALRASIEPAVYELEGVLAPGSPQVVSRREFMRSAVGATAVASP